MNRDVSDDAGLLDLSWYYFNLNDGELFKVWLWAPTKKAIVSYPRGVPITSLWRAAHGQLEALLVLNASQVSWSFSWFPPSRNMRHGQCTFRGNLDHWLCSPRTHTQLERRIIEDARTLQGDHDTLQVSGSSKQRSDQKRIGDLFCTYIPAQIHVRYF